MRALVADDEPGVTRLVSRALTGAGFTVDVVDDGAAAIRRALENAYDVLVLDIWMPGLDGHQVLKAVRAVSRDTRIVVMSADDGVDQRVSALDEGADDFVGKPFAVEELLARVRRRLHHHHHAPPPSAPAHTAIRLDADRHVAEIDGRVVRLSQREFGLLRRLTASAGEVCTREELLADVWGYTFDPGSNVVEVYVRRLRSKLPSGMIETVRHVGYRFAAS